MSNKKGPSQKVKQYIDYDYLKKLSEEERRWLQKFTSHYYYGFTDKKASKNENLKSYNRLNNARRDVFNNYRISDYIPQETSQEDQFLYTYYKEIYELFYKGKKNNG